jgi:hypothetical protein
LTREALRSVVRRVLGDVAKSGLPGEHHFYVTFDTQAAGVRLSPRLREQYPEAMTIVLQHQFYDLGVSDHSFEVGLSFNGVIERLYVPFEAITGFVDPSVQFGLQFETLMESEPAAETPAAAPALPPEKAARPSRKSAEKAAADKPDAADKRAPAKAEGPSGPDKPAGGAEVVRLDRFRKK